MTTELRTNTMVENVETKQKGRLIGRFIRKGEPWWTVYWNDGETTAEKESELQVG